MTNSFNVGDLARLAQSVIDNKDKGQEFMLEDVHNLVRTAYEKHPEDPVINQVARVIEKMASKSIPGATINQSEVYKVFNSFARMGNTDNFRDELGWLLKNANDNSVMPNENYIRHHRVDASGDGIKAEDLVDSNVVNALSSVFGGSLDGFKTFDSTIAKKGTEFVKAELNALGFNGTQVDIMGGNADNIVYTAHIDSHRGRVTIAIPTEVKDGRVLFPSTFVADDHAEELTSVKLNRFIDKKTQAGEFFLDSKCEEAKPDIDTTQEVEMPPELAHLARDFEDDILEAASSFGLKAIAKGKEIVARELRIAGFKNAQVKFGSEAGDSVVYLAQINTPKGPVEIEVPVEMQNVGESSIPLSPAYFAYDGLIDDFTPSKLQRFAISLPAPSSDSTLFSSAFSYMTLPELKDEILKAIGSDDYITCEVILAEIQEKFSDEDFRNAIADYHHILMHKTSMQEQEQRQCSRMIPAGKTSVYAVCGHFGVPMHKVAVDDRGNCRLKSAIEREKLNPSDKGGVATSTAKIFMA